MKISHKIAERMLSRLYTSENNLPFC